MLIIRNAADMAASLTSHLGAGLKGILRQHRDNLAEYGDFDFGELAFFVIVDSDDTAASVSNALGFDPTKNGGENAEVGPGEFAPLWETLTHHATWTEIVFILGEDGFGCVLLIPKTSGVDPSLAALCRA